MGVQGIRMLPCEGDTRLNDGLLATHRPVKSKSSMVRDISSPGVFVNISKVMGVPSKAGLGKA